MPRDSSGVYTLPLGNPVITNTTIDSTWANPTMQDIAAQLNNVLTRDGLLGPLGPMKIADGTVNAPGLTWNSEPGMGWYKPGPGLMSLVQGGKEIARYDSSDPTNTIIRTYSNSGSGVSGLVSANAGYAGNGGAVRLRATQTEMVLDSIGFGTGAALPLHFIAPTLNVDGTVNFTGQVNIPGTVLGGNAQYALQLRSGANPAGTAMTFTWNDPGTQPSYLWGSVDGATMQVYPPSRLSVNYANSAGSAPANGGTSANSSAVNGISGWTYTNSAANPAYIWCTDGSGTYQHLTQPGNLSVNYANSAGSANYAASAGSAPANGGTADNANTVGGYNQSQLVHNNNNVVWLQSNATIQMQANVGGTVVFWGTSTSDARLKTAVEDTMVDSLADIMRMHFVGHEWRQDLGISLPKSFVPVAVLAQEAERIMPQWINSSGTYKQPDIYAMLMSAMHAIQQLGTRVDLLYHPLG